MCSNVFTYLRCAYIYIYTYTYRYTYRYTYTYIYIHIDIDIDININGHVSLCAADPTCFYLLLLFQPRGVFFIHGLCQAARHPPSGSQRTTETDGVYFRIYAGGGENIPDLSHLISSHLSLSYIHMYIYICTCMYKYSYPVRRKKNSSRMACSSRFPPFL